RGKPLTAHGLGRLLKRYEITSHSVRVPPDGQSLKGFERKQFEDAWARYLPSEPLHRYKSGGERDSGKTDSATDGFVLRIENPGDATPQAGCSGVADEIGGLGNGDHPEPASDDGRE